MNRRELLGMSSVGVVVAALIGQRALMQGSSEGSGNFPVKHTDAEWRAKLNSESYNVLRKGATELPFTSPLVKEHRSGIFACAGCDQPLFSSKVKYDSKTGWPSFWESLPKATIKRPDFKMASPRTEIICSNCGGHLGHVFTDGPKPTGLRYCMNGDALTFKPTA
jgi:peptide-methionine (R)-S-oxide reductase